MTLCLPEPADIISAIEKELPAPANAYEQGLYICRLREIMKELHLFYTEEYNRIITELLGTKPSDTYILQMQYKETAKVNLSLLRTEKPDIFADLVYIKAPIAARILTKKYLYTLCREKVGETKIMNYEEVNKTDLRKVLPFDEINRYLTIEKEPEEYIILPRSEAAA